MRSKLGILALAALAMSADISSPSERYYKPAEPLTDEELKAIKEKQNIARGLKKFNIRGEEIWAINERTALKKYKKQF